ncbi:unnamed protein product [Adineta ricciae]|uniref:Spermatogenesis-associated protein 1 C-terminal domain-containing protein n=1 Tax=Adineta ricciae TaxID=249248 RepID=A0A813Z395_ADIRI|nr:unnamed protein product [Adineta ricciae]CAF1203833.1 unnamed protein product [Adineta ricciae]
MLQLRSENEQFSSLPSLRVLDHPRLSIITTDRPDSSQLVDLHVYIVPKNVWKDGQRLAQNEAMDDAISAGFVRVSPNMTIRELRRPIETLCGKESYFPRDFIYLRSVGRCLTKVKAKQEDELRVKNYRPPQTFAPEIYLLDGRQEDHAPNRSVSPVSTSPCDVCGNHDGHRADHEKHSRHREPKSDPDDNRPEYGNQRLPFADRDRSPTRISPNYYQKPMRGGKQYAPLTASHELFSNNPPKEKNNRSKYGQFGSDPEESISINLPKLKEEQERLRRRQAELERMRRAAEEKRARSQRSEGEHSRSDEDENDTKKPQGSFRGVKDRPNLSEQRRHTYKFDPPKRIEEEEDENKKLPVKKPATYQNSRRQTFPMPASILVKHDNPKTINVKRPKPTGNDNDYENTRNDISPLSSEGSNSSDSIITPTLSTEKPANPSAKIDEFIEPLVLTPDPPVQRPIDNRAHHNIVQSVPQKSSTTPPSKPTSGTSAEERKIHEEIDTERRNAEMKRRRQMEEDEEKKKEKQLSDQRRKDPFKGTNDDPNALRARHQEIYNRRMDLEKVREEVIKHLKNIHNRITLRRKEARDMWKKKYFNEKKKHPPLEERINMLRNELDQMHKKTVQTMEAEAKYAAQMGYTKEAANGNSVAQVTRMNYEIQDIRHQLEQAKLRLTTDVKLRNQAENECRTLRHELNQAKANLNDIKSRAGP